MLHKTVVVLLLSAVAPRVGYSPFEQNKDFLQWPKFSAQIAVLKFSKNVSRISPALLRSYNASYNQSAYKQRKKVRRTECTTATLKSTQHAISAMARQRFIIPCNRLNHKPWMLNDQT
jgi:hypothetical protein